MPADATHLLARIDENPGAANTKLALENSEMTPGATELHQTAFDSS